MERIKVIINPNGISAREVNKYGDNRPSDESVYKKGDEVINGKEREVIHNATVALWEEEEKKLRKFDIKNKTVTIHPNSKSDAIILEDGTLQIIPEQGDSFRKYFSNKVKNSVVLKDEIYFIYTKIGEPNFVKKGADFADKENAISLRDWTPEQLEAMAKFMRENPLCKLMDDGSGKI